MGRKGRLKSPRELVRTEFPSRYRARRRQMRLQLVVQLAVQPGVVQGQQVQAQMPGRQVQPAGHANLA
jgi:hypothetical protein